MSAIADCYNEKHDDQHGNPVGEQKSPSTIEKLLKLPSPHIFTLAREQLEQAQTEYAELAARGPVLSEDEISAVDYMASTAEALSMLNSERATAQKLVEYAHSLRNLLERAKR